MIARQATGSGSWRPMMNVLALVQKRVMKALRLKQAQLASLTYRGVPYTKEA